MAVNSTLKRLNGNDSRLKNFEVRKTRGISRGLYKAIVCAGFGTDGVRAREWGRIGPIRTPAATIHSVIHAINVRDAGHLRSCFLDQTPVEQAYAQSIGRLVESAGLLQGR